MITKMIKNVMYVLYNIQSCSGHFRIVWLKTSICCSLHIGTYMVQVSSFCESFAQNSKFDKFHKTSIGNTYVQYRVTSLEDQHPVYQYYK